MKNKALVGQVRICFNPSVFMKASYARMFVYSADSTFHKNRETFQEELRDLLKPVLGDESSRREAAKAIHGGVLPDWFDTKDQTELALIDNFAK